MLHPEPGLGGGFLQQLSCQSVSGPQKRPPSPWSRQVSCMGIYYDISSIARSARSDGGLGSPPRSADSFAVKPTDPLWSLNGDVHSCQSRDQGQLSQRIAHLTASPSYHEAVNPHALDPANDCNFAAATRRYQGAAPPRDQGQALPRGDIEYEL